MAAAEGTPSALRGKIKVGTSIQYKGGYMVNLDKVLGSGGQGTVCEAEKISDHKLVAAKGFPVPIVGENKSLNNELLARELSHENIVTFFECIQAGPFIWLFLELCDSDLQTLLSKSITAERRLDIIIQCIRGLVYLHGNKIVHRDIKPGNILIKGETVKLADFGLSKKLLTLTQMMSPGGTPHWAAPEMYDEKGGSSKEVFAKSIDIFSMGLVVGYVCQSEEHREAFKNYYGLIVTTQPGYDIMKAMMAHWEYCRGLQYMVGEMLQREPDRRPTAEKCLFSLSSAPPGITPITHTDTGFRGHWCLGLSANGDVLLADRGTDQLVLFSLSGGAFTQRWSRARPDNLSCYCRKAFSQEGNILLQEGDVTRVYTRDLEPVTSHRGDYGYLLTVLSGDRVVYEKKRDGVWVLDVVSLVSHQRLITLRPPGSRRWKYGGLSVCADELTGRIAVTDSHSKSLELFTATGDHISHMDLGYQPEWWSAVACSAQHIFVAECRSPTIHVHDWQGEELARLTHTQLQLGEDDCVRGLRCVQDGSGLILAVGPWPNVRSLHAYKISLR